MSPIPDTHDSSAPARGHLIYDHECQLCVSITARLSKAASVTDVTLVPYQSKEAQSLLGPTYAPGRPVMAYLIDAEGNCHQGLDAFIPLLSGLRWGKWVLPLWQWPLFRSCSYALYRLLAHYRYVWFGKAR